MDRERLRQLEEQCIQDRPPACTSACPVHVDARELCAAASRGDFAAARMELERAVPFPQVIARCCDAPCQTACVRGQAGGAIHIRDLERAAVEYGGSVPAAASQRRRRPGSAAVVGAGLSGLTAAYELARKGYEVVLFEEQDRAGGRAAELAEDVLPAAELAADVEKVMAAGVRFVPFTVVALSRPRGAGDLAALAPDADAIYLAAGAAEADAGAALGYAVDDRGLIAVDPVTLVTSRPGVYCGGSILRPSGPWSPITSIADGRRAALSIDRQLQKVSLAAAREDRGGYETELIVDLEGVADEPPVEASGPGGYTPAAATEEARRCLQCECLECVKACAYLEAFGSHPGKYARRVYNNLTMTTGRGARSANKMIDSCSLCRLCYEVCPTDLDFAEVIRDARRQMVRDDKMPASAFDFAVQDLRLAVAEPSALARHAPGTQASEAVFFPGCQLAASDPDQVERVYAYLRECYSPATGILLYCCGAPADWAGQAGLFEDTLTGLRGLLAGLGSPRVILACPTCQAVFAQHLPEVETTSLYEVLAERGLPEGVAGSGAGRRVAVHDACTARYQTSVQRAVRDLVGACGYEVEELELSRERTECCGFGGLMLYANPEIADAVAARRVGSADADFVAYCAMCRDRFAAKGKPTSHVLDLFFGADYSARAARRGPVLTQRSEQRAALKERLLAGVWGEGAVRGAEWRERLVVTATVEDLLEERFIRPEEVLQVVERAEQTGRYFVEPATGRRLASLVIGAVTYWVEYGLEDSRAREGEDARELESDRARVHTAYSHRIEIKPPPWPSTEGLESDDGRTWRCALGDHPLEARTVTLSYLVAGFPVKLLACAEHGMVLITEALATGRMLEVELALEDK